MVYTIVFSICRFSRLVLRERYQVPEIFCKNNEDDGENGYESLEALIHAEILLSCLKTGSTTSIPTWFEEDLAFLFRASDPIDSAYDPPNTFKARVYWLLTNWHYFNGRIEIATNYLEMVIYIVLLLTIFFSFLLSVEIEFTKIPCFILFQVKQAFRSIESSGISEDDKVPTVRVHSIEDRVDITSVDVQQMELLLVRTMQLEDVIKLHESKKYKELVEILKTTFSSGSESTIRYKKENNVFRLR